MNLEFTAAGLGGRQSSTLVKALAICFAALAMVYGIAQIAERSDPMVRAAIASTSDGASPSVEIPSVSGNRLSPTDESLHLGMLAERVDEPRQCQAENAIVNACIYE